MREFKDEAMKILKGKTVDEMTEPEVFLMLHVINEELQESEDAYKKMIQRACVIRLINSKAVYNAIRFRVENMYARYGCEELQFVYDNASINEFYNHAFMFVVKDLEKFTDNTIEFPRKEGQLDLSMAAFRKRLTSGISRPIKWALKDFIVEKAHEGGLEKLNKYYLTLYTQLRAITCQEVDLFDSNEKILSTLEKYNDGMLVSTELTEFKLNAMKEAFNEITVKKESVAPEKKLIDEDLIKALNILPDIQKEIIKLRYFSNTERIARFTEVAKVLNLTADQVRYQESKALKTLREAVG